MLSLISNFKLVCFKEQKNIFCILKTCSISKIFFHSSVNMAERVPFPVFAGMVLHY